MSRRRGRLPSSLPLPLYDDIGSPSEPPADAPLPTVFISYSHDTPAHVERVQFLAAQLKEGDVHCEIDTSQISPPQGWPLWMQEQIERSDFVIVVCTATYAGRFTGRETLPGRGKGVRWEGLLISASLGYPTHPAPDRRQSSAALCRTPPALPSRRAASAALACTPYNPRFELNSPPPVPQSPEASRPCRQLT